jgi:hypothetical protein
VKGKVRCGMEPITTAAVVVALAQGLSQVSGKLLEI